MIHEVKFPSYNQRDDVYGWIYVPACKIKGVVQLVHGFGEHSRRYLHMICKFMDAETKMGGDTNYFARKICYTTYNSFFSPGGLL